MTRRFEVFSTAVLLTCALLITGVVVRRELSSPPNPLTPKKQKDWRQVGAKGQSFGAQAGQVQLVVFSDFQCPFCRAFASTLDSLLASYPTQLHVVFRHFPIAAIHPNAFAFAVASECASAQGRFKPFHDEAFRHQDSLGAMSPSTIAIRAGVPDTA
jgi:protein-disulfide isomerase